MTERDRLLRRIQAEDFALYETVLYLDGHPQCKRALAQYHKHKNNAKALREEFEGKYGPLTIYGNQSDCDWHWVTKPWPWEKEAN
ncbi:MAG: spore coat protein CotJB [Clostridia bacterium]|nr:spore coat protein CotJB [Clostridia bacterium]MBP3555780.1 spore coat protein CotJB [Clostridia bacterium]MBQ8420255.1 spore coat protein CotJB [Clostridia bacterium]